jgi:sacsin
VEYARLRNTCPDQLAPFEGLWGFDSSSSSYDGTIFRFPLRKDGEDSELLEALRCPDVSTVIEIFRNSLDEARLALLFLRNIITIDFSVKHNDTSDWTVRRGDWPESATFSDWANIMVEKTDHLGKTTRTSERWWRVIVDVPDAPAHLQHRHKRMMKNVECGIAALVPRKGTVSKSPLRQLKGRFFNCLPLKFESTLPVQIHATFLLSGDRQNIAIEETSQDAGSEWNKWLLEQKLPDVYLQFLEDIGRKIGNDTYEYFPVEVMDTPHLLSDRLRTSFWGKVRSSSCRLFPVTQLVQDFPSSIMNGSPRSAPSLITFEQSLFDLLDEQDFDSLRQLLRGFCNNLVHPPHQLRQHIKDVTGAKVLTPAVVRDALKAALPVQIEKTIQSDKDFLSTLLSFVMPRDDQDIIDLHGCPILPLATGEVGVLSLRATSNDNDSKEARTYYSASTECQSIFSFASSVFCARTGNTKFVEEIVKLGLLNVKRLEKADVSTLLSYRNSPKFLSEAWLCRFWRYMNTTTHTQAGGAELEPLNLDLINRFPLVLLRNHDNKESVESLQYFQNEPVVVQSTTKCHMDVFADFPGLLIADTKTLPSNFRVLETSLSDSRAMKRFLKSVSTLASRAGKSFTEYVKASLKQRNIKVRRA